MSTYVTEGLVLSLRPHRESSRLYTIYTKDFGKVEAVATGSLKISSKLAPHLLPLSQVEIMVAKGKIWDRLAGAKIIKTLIKLNESKKIILAQGYLEVVNKLTGWGQSSPDIYNLLISSLEALGNLQTVESDWREPARQMFFGFSYQILKVSGLAPDCRMCELCHKDLGEDTLFDWQNHGFVHNSCCSDRKYITSIDQSTKAWLAQVIKSGNIMGPMPSTAYIFLNKYMSGQIGQELATLKVLKNII